MATKRKSRKKHRHDFIRIMKNVADVLKWLVGFALMLLELIDKLKG
ncbi:MAG: hypothetical protein IJ597_03065 [Synergistaceae bacterium]|nr:hypothetical protein [Synergistaceae bacterium]